ncbi:MAG: hypothetical protein ABR991_08065 [Terracidiphilus sp.]
MMENGWVKKNKWIFVAGPLALVLFIWIGGEVVMLLWNWLLPVLFGVRTINLWQALGLLVLSRILFGGWGCGGNDRSKSQRPSDENWKKMTPEEREKLRAEMRSRWCGGEAPIGEPKAQG